jgi:hypothetical protein
MVVAMDMDIGTDIDIEMDMDRDMDTYMDLHMIVLSAPKGVQAQREDKKCPPLHISIFQVIRGPGHTGYIFHFLHSAWQ